MTIMKSEFLRVVHEHNFSAGVFGTAEFPSMLSQVPYRYNNGSLMSMSDMYCVLDWQEEAMKADKAGTWPDSFIVRIMEVRG